MPTSPTGSTQCDAKSLNSAYWQQPITAALKFLHQIFKFGTTGLKVQTEVITAKYMSELQDYNF
jgi:hypothetical protein